MFIVETVLTLGTMRRRSSVNEAQPAIRRFSLADGMIVVAALAATLALAKLTLPVVAKFPQEYYYLTHLPPSSPGNTWSRENYNLWLPIPVRGLGLMIGYMVLAIISVWMVAYAAMRLRQPRPALRVVSLQPGMVACWTAAASAFATGLLILVFGGRAIAGAPALVVMGLAIPLAWGRLKATKRWRPEASWIDRLGCGLGLCWWVVTWLGAAFLGYVTVMWDTPGFLLPPWARHG